MRPMGLYTAHHKRAYIYVKDMFRSVSLWMLIYKGSLWKYIGCSIGPLVLYKAHHNMLIFFMDKVLILWVAAHQKQCLNPPLDWGIVFGVLERLHFSMGVCTAPQSGGFTTNGVHAVWALLMGFMQWIHC